MAEINELIAQVTDENLRAKLQEAVDKMNKQKKFGLVFEEHKPEFVPLYDMPIHKGSLVVKKNEKTGISGAYIVLNAKGNTAVCIPKAGGDTVEIPKSELVSIAEFGEPIYPYLQMIDSVENAPDSNLWHTLIEADNYHALQLLEYLYSGKVDCIYIDPPYNTGAKDWKYNNDYVDGADQYRHSKWLSMMEKRLRLAKKLLNPADSVLIVTIDEKEYLHLGCLLEEIFQGERIQMITSMTNKKGQPRTGIFSRTEEYIFFIYIGNNKLTRTTENMLFAIKNDEKKTTNQPAIWSSLLRRGTHSARSDRPKLFYPIIIDECNNKILRIGDSLDLQFDKNSYIVPKGCIAAFPLHKDGSEGNWQMKPDTLRAALLNGTAKLGRKDKNNGTWSIVYLKRKQLQQLKNGEIICDGKDENGAMVLHYPNDGMQLLQEPRSLWVKDSHDASVYGSTLLNSIIGEKRFSFPKSLYAVRDTINFFVANKPNALIIDFFAGSGTTLHAVNLLNAEDGGNRRCIMVTNNEVSSDEEKSLTEKGYNPGDEEWEKLGIARYVTWPRTICSIEGHDINGTPLKGNYLGSDMPMADGFKANAVFFKLGFLDKNSVALGRQFREMIPTLWMKAGGYGKCPVYEDNKEPKMLILPQNHFAVLCKESCFTEFETKVKEHNEIDTIFIVTDYESGYRAMAKCFEGKQTFQLYRDYLDNFRINVKRN